MRTNTCVCVCVCTQRQDLKAGPSGLHVVCTYVRDIRSRVVNVLLVSSFYDAEFENEHTTILNSDLSRWWSRFGFMINNNTFILVLG